MNVAAEVKDTFQDIGESYGLELIELPEEKDLKQVYILILASYILI